MSVYGDLMKLDEAKKSSTEKVESSQSPTPQQDTSIKTVKKDGIKTSRHHSTMPPRYHDTTIPRYQDTTIELIRKAVKEFGKEAATHRFTPEEKRAIANIVYAYDGLGVRTNENVITRIAINFVINDYNENGEESILAKALKALNG